MGVIDKYNREGLASLGEPDIIEHMMTNTERFHFLTCLMREGVATPAEQKEFFDLCDKARYAIIWDNVKFFTDDEK